MALGNFEMLLGLRETESWLLDSRLLSDFGGWEWACSLRKSLWCSLLLFSKNLFVTGLSNYADSVLRAITTFLLCFWSSKEVRFRVETCLPVWLSFFVVPGIDFYLYYRVVGDNRGGGRFGVFNRIKWRSNGRVLTKTWFLLNSFGSSLVFEKDTCSARIFSNFF